MKKTLNILTACVALATTALVSATSAQAKPTLVGDEAAIIAALGGGSFTFTNDVTTYQQIAAAAVSSHLPVKRAIIAAFSLADAYGLTARDADPYILRAVSAANASKAGNVGLATQSAFVAIKNTTASKTLSVKSNVIATTSDDAAVAAALASSAIDGVLSIPSSSLSDNKKLAAIKKIVGSAVKGSVKGTVIADGAAGVATGAVSLAQLSGSTSSDAFVAAIVTAAVKASKNDILAIAQAAAEAGAFVYGNPAGYSNSLIENAAKAGYKPKKVKGTLATDLTSAVALGIQAAADIINNVGTSYGIGAAGVLNYAYNSGAGSPITDITGL